MIKSPALNKTKLLYHINKLIDIYSLHIFLSITLNILVIAYKKSHLSFAQCYEIISCSWFVWNLTKFLYSFIRHCSQDLALKTRQYSLYEFSYLIDSFLVLFFTLTQNFMLVLLATKKRYNLLMSVTCKFWRWITLIEGVDI